MTDEGAGRRALLLLAPATFFQGYDDLLLGLALPLIAAELHLSAARAGLAVSVVQAGSFGVLLLLPLADRVGRRPVLIATLAGYTLATGATALSRGVVDLVAYQFAARIFLGTEYALATIVVVELVPAERRGRALAVLTSMSALGMAGAGAAFLAVARAGGSWRILYAFGIVPLALVALARRGLAETARPAAAG
ncbi:MAG TPA: MFS transporter, partial [Actinomycetota bacterium]|nr:MFS transporter [Actinomycetota bacterium]